MLRRSWFGGSSMLSAFAGVAVVFAGVVGCGSSEAPEAYPGKPVNPPGKEEDLDAYMATSTATADTPTTAAPTAAPTQAPTSTATQTAATTAKPTAKPTAQPTAKPTAKPTAQPTAKPKP